MKKTLIFTLLLFSVMTLAFPKKKTKTAPVDEKVYDLALSQDDILVLPEDSTHLVKDGNGVHLFVRKRGDIQSVLLLVDSGNYNDPDLSLMRAKEFNSVNGNEVRYVYGSKSTFRMERTPNALMSSTVENWFGEECFHIYVPQKMYYGYVIQVQNETEFEDGMKVSVRSFAQKFCDAGGKFTDNMLTLNVSDWQTEESFSEIAKKSGGKISHVSELTELTKNLVSEVEEFDVTEKIEVVFAIDATDSMKDDFAELRKNWLSKFEKQMKRFKDIKIGLLFYKDYGDEFKTNGLPVKNMGFVKNAKEFSKAVKNVSVRGGGDKEEAVYEALYACETGFNWSEDAKKKIILIGDAPPNPSEKLSKNGFSHTAEEILSNIAKKGINVDCFLISNPETSVTKMKNIEKTDAPKELLNSVDTIDAK